MSAAASGAAPAKGKAATNTNTIAATVSPTGILPGLLPCSLIICVNLDQVISFFEALFASPENRVKAKHTQAACHYASLQLSPHASVVLVESGSCDEEMKAAFSSMGCFVRQLFIHDRNSREIQARALKLGILSTESSLVDVHMCVVEGPEGICVHILEGDLSQGDMTVPGLIMKTLLDRLEGQDADKEMGGRSKRTGNRAPRVPGIRTVDVALQSDYHPLGKAPCPANNRNAVPFETELFKGIAMIAVRTDPIDPLFKNFFEGTKRTFEVQVQGKFKRMPVGEIYVGADVTNKMELGIITRSFSRAILKFIASMVNDLHYSFGDFPDTVGFEKPHIVAPLFPTMDKIVETPEGGEPPPMGKPFPEDPEYRKLRFKNKCTNDMIHLSSTYSFSVNTNNMDLVTWNLVGIPMLKALDMRTFFGESPICLVGYELPAEIAVKHPSKHPVSALNYVFNMNLNRADTNASQHGDDESASSDSTAPEEERSGEIPNPALLLDDIEEEGDKSSDGEEADEDAKDDDGTTTRKARRGRGVRLWRRSTSPQRQGEASDSTKPGGPRRKKIGRWLRREIGDFFHHDKEKDTPPGPGGSPKATKKGDDHSMNVEHTPPGGNANDFETSSSAGDECFMESDEDLRFCPACIDAIDHRGKEGKRRTLFAFPWVPPTHDWADCSASSALLASSPNTKLTGSQLLGTQALSPHIAGGGGGMSVLTPIDSGAGEPHANIAPYIIKLRSHSDFEKTFPLAKLSKCSKIKRLTSVERERRQLAETYALMLGKGSSYNPVMDAFFGAPSDSDRLFLSESLSKGSLSSSSSSVGSGGGKEFWEGSVAFATDKRHWVEGMAFLSQSELTLCKSSDQRKVILNIPLQSIICVRAMRPEEAPMDMFGFLQVETFSRVLYFLVRSERQRDSWLGAFSSIGATSRPNYSEMSLSKLVEDLYFGMSTSWRLDKKRLFNYRNIIFRRTGLSPEFKHVSVEQLAEGMSCAVIVFLLYFCFFIVLLNANRTVCWPFVLSSYTLSLNIYFTLYYLQVYWRKCSLYCKTRDWPTSVNGLSL
jgi:hypothetical protein